MAISYNKKDARSQGLFGRMINDINNICHLWHIGSACSSGRVSSIFPGHICDSMKHSAPSATELPMQNQARRDRAAGAICAIIDIWRGFVTNAVFFYSIQFHRERSDEMPEEIRWVKTHCARMDHGGCSLLVGVKGNEIVQVKGDPEGYLNKGYTCFKGRVSPDRLTHPDRLRHPLKRAGERGEGKWQRISWEQALDETAENLLENQGKTRGTRRGVRRRHAEGARAFRADPPCQYLRLPQRHRLPGRLSCRQGDHGPSHLRLLSRCRFAPPHETDVLLGQQPGLHQRGGADLQPGERPAEGRRKNDRRRSPEDRACREGRPLAPTASRHGPGAGPGDHPRHLRGGSLRQGLRGEVHPRFRRSGAARQTILS